MADGFFRSKKGFTVVQNTLARDKRLSLRAKGLYLTIQANITIPDTMWKKSQFFAMTKEGEKAFDSAWKELKDAGYLKVYMKSNGKNFISEFELLDEPVEGAHTFYLNSKGEITKTDIEKYNKNISNDIMDIREEENKGDCETAEIVDSFRIPQKGTYGDENRIPQNGIYGNGIYGNGIYGDGIYGNGGYNINTNNKDLNINTSNQIPSINNQQAIVDNSLTCISNDDDEMGYDHNITLDITRNEYRDSIEEYRNILFENDGIPLEYAFEPEKIKLSILAMSGWDYKVKEIAGRERGRKYPNEEDELYVTMVRNLIEMALNKETVIGGKRKVTYKHIIDKLNQIYHKDEFKGKPLDKYLFMCVKRFREASAQTKIVKIDQYCKSLLWNNFDTFVNDWNDYFNRTYYGEYKN